MPAKSMMVEEDIKNELKEFLRNRRHASRNNRNIRRLISWVGYLNLLKEDEILDDKTFDSAIASVASAFIISEINDKVYRVILKIFTPNSLEEISRDLEKG